MASIEERRQSAETVDSAGERSIPAGQGVQADPVRSESLLESISSMCTVLAVGLFLMGFVFQNFVIPSGSMEKTLLIGDHVMVDRVTLAPRTSWAPFLHYRNPQRGDVIVFFKPNPESPDLVLVKRCIGVPGDHIHLIHGVVYLNGVAQNEPYAHPVQDDSDPFDAYDPARDDFPANGVPTGSTEVWSQELSTHIQGQDIVVPPDKYFAMGDNRTHSLDGRFWGFVPRQNIIGRPLFNYWSYRSTADQTDAQNVSFGARVGSFFSTAAHFLTRTRWSRTLHLIR
jgi:signal peptidase I